MSIMHRDSEHPRRLRVSSLAAVANPSYTRIDTWNLLDDACHHLATMQRAGLDQVGFRGWRCQTPYPVPLVEMQLAFRFAGHREA